MKTKEAVLFIEKLLKQRVSKDTIFFYDYINLVPIARDKDGNRDYSEDDCYKLAKAVAMAGLNCSLRMIDRVINKRDIRAIEYMLKKFRRQNKHRKFIGRG